MTERLDIGKCLSEGWQFFVINPWLAIGGFVLYVVLVMAGSFIPIIQIFFGILISPILVGGISLFAINLAGNTSPKIEDLFAGFKIFGRVMGVYWLYMVAVLVMMVPSFVFLGMAISAGGSETTNWGLILVMLLNIVAIMIIMLRWMPVFYVMMDEESIDVIGCFRHSAQLTEGNRGQLFLLMFAIGAIGGALFLFAALMFTLGPVGRIVAIVPFVVLYFAAAPLVMIIMARAYLWLKSFHPPYQQGAVSVDQTVSP